MHPARINAVTDCVIYFVSDLPMNNINVFISDKRDDKCSSHCGSCGGGRISFDMFKYTVDVICEEYDVACFTFEFSGDHIDTSLMRAILRYEKRVIKKRGVRFMNSIRLSDCVPRRRDIRFCKKNKVQYELVFSNTASLMTCLSKCGSKMSCDSILINEYSEKDMVNIYRFAARYCKLLRFKHDNVPPTVCTDESATAFANSVKQLFDEWLTDINGIDVRPISDHIRSGFGINIGKDCTNSSCLGKAIALKPNGDLSACPYLKSDESKLGNIKNISLVSEVFNGDKFKTIVSEMVVKRKKCMKSCEAFNYCRSGCCKELVSKSFSPYYCMVLKELDMYIEKRIRSIVSSNEDLAVYNPILVNMIKDIICLDPVSMAVSGSV